MAKTSPGISVAAAGRALGVSASTVWRMIRRGDLSSVRHRGRRLVLRRSLANGSVRALPQEEERAKAILSSHADKDWSLCDVISFAVLESRGARTAFTFDRHFRQYGRFDILGLAS